MKSADTAVLAGAGNILQPISSAIFAVDRANGHLNDVEAAEPNHPIAEATSIPEKIGDHPVGLGAPRTLLASGPDQFTIMADERCNAPVDIRACPNARAADTTKFRTPELGVFNATAEAAL